MGRYWCKYILITPNQMTAGALVISYWIPATRVNPGVWITIFLLLIVLINYFGVRFFGEFEFWLSSIKVIVICGVILLSLILALGGGPDHDRKGFRYWKNPGAFNTYITDGDAGKFYAFWSTMVTATFAYLGTELVGVTVGEAQNPRKTIPRAIRLTFYRILVFYILSVFLVGMLVPYNSKELAFATSASSSAAASPFVVAIQLAKIPALPHIMNACILIFVFSACNSDLYIATRTIYGLAREGKAPAILAYTDRRGVPVYALGLSSLFSLLAYMNVSSDSKIIFGYFVNLVTIFGLLTWISILVTHIYFVKARKAQNVPDQDLAFTAPFGPRGSYFALFFCILIALTKSFDAFTHSPKWGNFDYKTFITSYLGIPLYLILLFGYKFTMGSKGVKPHEADLWTGKEAIDQEEAAFLARQALESEKTRAYGSFYHRFVSWLF
jgi:amino acid transporter